MAMYFLSEYQEMMAGGHKGPALHVNNIDDRLGLPPPDPDLYHQDAYRCPVSTPAHSRRPNRGEEKMFAQPAVPDEQMYVAFANKCQNPQRNVSNGQKTYHKTQNNKQLFDEPRSKGRHYYFIARIQPAALTTNDSPVRSRWLNTLCSQPVEEIFVKYKRRLEASLVREAWNTRDVSTPGEKALVSAWSCNSSQRSQSCTPSLRSPTPRYSSTAPNSRLSVYSPVKGNGYESDSDLRKREPEFSLVPVVSSKTLLHKVNTSPRSSVSSIKSHMINENKRRIKSSNDIYDKYKREPRRQKKLLPKRGNVYKLAEETNSTGASRKTEEVQTNENANLEQSTFEVVSFGASSQEGTKKTTGQGKNKTFVSQEGKLAPTQGGKHPANQCRFCLRDKEEEKLPDIIEKG